MKKTTLYFMLLVAFLAQAQWNTDTAVNTLVATSNSGDAQSLGTSEGASYIVFWKEVPAPTNFELRAQLLDADGNQQWGADGILISDQIPMSTFTSFWFMNLDAEDNLYVGVTGTSNDTGLAYKVNLSGEVLWTVTLPTEALVVTPLPLDSGNVIISWFDTENFIATMQKFDGDGNAIWESPKQVSLSGASAPADVFEVSNEEFVFVYHQLGNGVSSTLYAEGFDTDGNATWSAPVQLSNTTTAFNAIYSSVKDGDVVYYGYSGAVGSRFDSYLQRIDPDGTLPWGINGVDFDTNMTDFEMDTRIAIEPDTNDIWAVCTYTNPSQGEVGEYVQKFDKHTGARQFTDNAKEVYAIGSNNVHAGTLHLVNNQPLFLIKSGFDNGGTPTSLNACYLDANGDFVWDEELVPMATFAANKGRIQFNKPVNGQVVAVFVEDRGEGNNMYAQNFADESILSVESQDEQFAFTYINPVKDVFTLRSKTVISTLKVTNILGQKVLEIAPNTTQISMDVANWEASMYIVSVANANGAVESFRVIKQ